MPILAEHINDVSKGIFSVLKNALVLTGRASHAFLSSAPIICLFFDAFTNLYDLKRLWADRKERTKRHSFLHAGLILVPFILRILGIIITLGAIAAMLSAAPIIALVAIGVDIIKHFWRAYQNHKRHKPWLNSFLTGLGLCGLLVGAALVSFVPAVTIAGIIITISFAAFLLCKSLFNLWRTVAEEHRVYQAAVQAIIDKHHLEHKSDTTLDEDVQVFLEEHTLLFDDLEGPKPGDGLTPEEVQQLNNPDIKPSHPDKPNPD